MQDSLGSGRKVRLLNVIDDCTRECLCIEVSTGFSGLYVTRVLERLCQQRGCPETIRSDNGTEFVSTDVQRWAKARGIKWHCIEPGRYCGFILLFDTSNGELIAMLNDGIIQHTRVGATAGVGARYLARKDAAVVGMLGSGGMAHAYLEAMCHERPIRECRIFSPTTANRERFASEMAQKLRIKVTPVASKEEALDGADIATLCTDSRVPIFTANMVGLLKPGALIINVRHDEIDAETYDACDRVIITCNSKINDLVLGTSEQRARRPMDKHYRRRYVDTSFEELAPIVGGKAPGRNTDTELIFFHNMSAGIQFAGLPRKMQRWHLW